MKNTLAIVSLAVAGCSLPFIQQDGASTDMTSPVCEFHAERTFSYDIWKLHVNYQHPECSGDYLGEVAIFKAEERYPSCKVRYWKDKNEGAVYTMMVTNAGTVNISCRQEDQKFTCSRRKSRGEENLLQILNRIDQSTNIGYSVWFYLDLKREQDYGVDHFGCEIEAHAVLGYEFLIETKKHDLPKNDNGF